MQIPGYKQTDFDKQYGTIEGIFPLMITGVRNRTQEFKEPKEGKDPPAMAMEIEFSQERNPDLPFDIKHLLFIYAENKSRGKKSSWWKFNQLADAAGIVDAKGNCEPRDLIGRKVLVLLYRGEKGYTEVYEMFYKPLEEYREVLQGRFDADTYVKRWSGKAAERTSGNHDEWAPAQPIGGGGATEESDDPPF